MGGGSALSVNGHPAGADGYDGLVKKVTLFLLAALLLAIALALGSRKALVPGLSGVALVLIVCAVGALLVVGWSALVARRRRRRRQLLEMRDSALW